MKEKIIAHKKPLILIALAVVVLFCLWYTRPKSWNDIAEEYGTPREVKASVSIYEYDNTWEHMMSRYYDLEVEGDDPRAAALVEILDNNSYRPMLRTLFPVNGLDGGSYEDSEIWAAILTVNLIYDESVLHLSIMGDRLAVNPFPEGASRGYIIRDGSLSDALALFIRDNGVLDGEHHW